MSALTVNDGFSTWSPSARCRSTTRRATRRPSSPTSCERAACEVGSPGTGDRARDTRPRSPPSRRRRCTTSSHSMLSSSDNLTAEMLTKELGVQASQAGHAPRPGSPRSPPSSRSSGVPARRRRAQGRVRPRPRQPGHVLPHLVATLTLAEPSRASRRSYDGLARRRSNGTLVRRLPRHPARRAISAGKTGSLDGVTGLTGVFDLGRRIRFAFLDNGQFSETQGEVIREGIGDIIGRYPDSPPVDALVPAPAVGFGSRWNPPPPSSVDTSSSRQPVAGRSARTAAHRRSASAREATAAAAAAGHRAARPRRPLRPRADPHPAAEARPLHRLRGARVAPARVRRRLPRACPVCGRCRTRPATRSAATGPGSRT